MWISGAAKMRASGAGAAKMRAAMLPLAPLGGGGEGRNMTKRSQGGNK